ncbi:hypothetical protein [Dyella sp.]|uniref:hypothetical protein n=1 Tax=Dyella sp. TaxID=1869338 RepID=UPI002D78F176|nr:hypothetical protein [Dyella sp.]HET7332011.1 hypothetical protein [Dyella sp.]
MYRLKSTTDLSFLSDVCIEQLCVSAGALTIGGDNRVSIKIFASFAISTLGRSYTRFNGSVEDAMALLPLIGDCIREAKATVDGGMQVDFKSGAVLMVFDDSDQFESFTIEYGDLLIVV